jgi:aspartate racemase
MSWESTALYYQTINREVSLRLGGLRSAPFHLISLDFEEIVVRQRAQDWEGMSKILAQAACKLEVGGADCVLIGTNTMHRIAPEVQSVIGVPLIHIAEVTARAIVAKGLKRVGLLGTRFTMEQSFYTDHLAEFGIECIVPSEAARAEVHRIIFEELCKGEFREESRRAFQEICTELGSRGAEAIVLGCTEIPLILGSEDIPLPIFDTTRLHALAAVDFALAGHSPGMGSIPISAS